MTDILAGDHVYVDDLNNIKFMLSTLSRSSVRLFSSAEDNSLIDGIMNILSRFLGLRRTEKKQTINFGW